MISILRSTIKQEHTRARFLPLSFLSLGLVLLVWYIVTATGYIRPIFLPSPFATAKALWELLISGIFFKALLVSFTRIAVATFFGFVAWNWGDNENNFSFFWYRLLFYSPCKYAVRSTPR